MNSVSDQRIIPTSIRMDATTFCQLKCPSCPTADGSIKKTLGSQHLNFKIFESILENNPTVRHIELSNWGELFLNPKLLQMMELAFKKGVKLTAKNGSNLNYIKPEVIEGLVKYKFDHINCSIDGVSQEVYEQYRKKGNIENVFKNIQEINHYKKKFQSEFPKLNWQFIVFKHNFHEIPAAKALAKKFNMQIRFKLSWDEDLVPDPKHNEWIFKETGLQTVSRAQFKKKNNETYAQKQICGQLWKQPQINSDGRILGCCVNTWGDFGTYTNGNLERVLNGEPIVYARKMLMGQAEDRKDIPCSSCTHYHEMKKTKDWMTAKNIGMKSKLHRNLERVLPNQILRAGIRVRNQVKELWYQ